MAGCALLMRFDARTGKQDEVEALLRSMQPRAGTETGAGTWFSLRMAPEIYGLFATFTEDSQRQAFLDGLARSWDVRTSELLSRPPVTEKVEIVAQSGVLTEVPAVSMAAPGRKGPGAAGAGSHLEEIPKVGSRDAPGG